MPVPTESSGDPSHQDQQLYDALLALARGELSHRITRSGERDTADATAFLFNAMADQIEDLVKSLDAERSRLEDGVAHLSGVLTSMAAADFGARVGRTYDGSPLDVLAFLVNATAEELGAVYTDLLESNARLERQAKVQVNERLASMNTLAAGVGHELRNPLGVAAGHLEYLESELARILGDGYDAGLAEVLTDTRLAVARAATIATELVSLRPAHEESKKHVYLDRALGTAIRLVRTIVQHRAQLETHVEPDLIVYMDEARIGQVLVNLVHNAALAMPLERSRSDNLIQLRAFDAGNGEVAIEVRDNGVGMSQDVVHRAFEAFFTTRPVGEGTGLGLAICQELVASQGGRIEIESQLGEGTVFRITLPFAREATPVLESVAPAPSGPDVAVLLENIRGLKVLLIEDETLFHVVVEHMLGPDVALTATPSGTAGLELARSGDFDAILSDLMLPDIDGMTIYETLVADDSGTAKRVAFITGGSFSREAQQFIESVDAPVLGKPFTRCELLATVLQVAGRPSHKG